MANYKVILRQSVDQDDNFWEPGCPLIVETLQVSRNTETGEAYLQVKIKNLSAQTISSFHATFTASFEQQEDQVIEVKKLDADLAPGKDVTLPPTLLLDGAVQAVHYAIDQAKGKAVDWQSQTEVQPLPSVQLQPLDEEARQERSKLLKEAHISNEEATDRAIVVGDGWWRCACGGVTVGTTRCNSCSNEQSYLFELEQEEFLHKKAEERAVAEKEVARKAAEKEAQTKEHTKKALKVAIPVVAVLILAALIWVLAINPMLQNNEIQSLSDEGRHEEAIELLLERDNPNDTLDRQVEVIDAAADANNLVTVYDVYSTLDPNNPNVSHIIDLMKDYVEGHHSTDDPVTMDYVAILKTEMDSSEFAEMVGIEFEFSLTSWAQYKADGKKWCTVSKLIDGYDLPMLLIKATSLDPSQKQKLMFTWEVRDGGSTTWRKVQAEPETLTVTANDTLNEASAFYDNDSWLTSKHNYTASLARMLETGEWQVSVTDAATNTLLFKQTISH